MVPKCVKCGNDTPACELFTYNQRCENCAIHYRYQHIQNYKPLPPDTDNDEKHAKTKHRKRK